MLFWHTVNFLLTSRISYTNLIEDTATRQESLSSQYYFYCDCDCCVGDSGREDDLLKQRCLRKDKPGADAEYDTIKKEFSERVIENKGRHPEPEEQCLDYYRSMKGIFHPYDKTYQKVILQPCQYLPSRIILLSPQVLELAYEQAIAGEEFETAFDISRDLLVAYEKFYPENDVNTGLMAMKAGKLALYLDEFAESRLEKQLPRVVKCRSRLDKLSLSYYRTLFAKAEKVLKVTHGPGHPLLKEKLNPLVQECKVYLRQANGHKQKPIE